MHVIELTWNEALSGIFGSISLAAWIFLLLPQLVANYRQGHADGISLTFLAIWFVGDVTNLAGALWARLVPTVIALAVYFCFADTILIAQCLYYLGIKSRRVQEHGIGGGLEAGDGAVQSEHTPLLNGDANKSPTARGKPKRRLTDVTEDNLGLPGSRRLSSTTQESRRRRSTQDDTSLPRILEESTGMKPWLENTLSFLGVIAVGAAGWAIAWKAGAWRPTPLGQEGGDDSVPVGAEILGYISAVCYLGARIPQIVKNQRERSCEGLALLFFMLSLLGNLTYGAGILFHSLERQYVITNIPWLVGSLGTIVEDVIIFIQFHVFGDKKAAAVA